MGDGAPKVSAIYVAVAVTAEVLGHDLSERAAEAMARELAQYAPELVVAALQRCQRELSGRLTLAAVIQRIDDGRPGPDEAWALCPRDEAQTVVWTDEISEAYASAAALDGDRVAQRMAFREHYARLVQDARNERRPARWWASLGHDVGARAGALLAAAEAKRIAPDVARGLLDHGRPEHDRVAAKLLQLEGKPVPELPAPGKARPGHEAIPDDVKAEIAALCKRVGNGGGDADT